MTKEKTVCGEECEVYSRVTGYHRPLKNWNKGKREEFRQRRPFSLERAKPMLEKPRYKVKFTEEGPIVEKLGA